MKARYDSYLYESNGQLYYRDRLDEPTRLRDPYGVLPDVQMSSSFIAKALECGILKHVWSTTEDGEYI